MILFLNSIFAWMPPVLAALCKSTVFFVFFIIIARVMITVVSVIADVVGTVGGVIRRVLGGLFGGGL